MFVFDLKVVHEDFKFPSNEHSRYLLELKLRLFIKIESYHLTRTYARRSCYCFEYSIQKNLFLSNFAIDIFLVISIREI